MPYKVKKQGDEYVVYKKDTNKRVGATAGNKEALRKYLAALHLNANESLESIDEESKGLWANIRAKQARGEKSASKGSEAYNKAVTAAEKIKTVKNKTTLSEIKQKLAMQKHAGVISEDQYEKRLKLAEAPTSALGSTGAIGLSKIAMNLASTMSTTGAKDAASNDDKIASNPSWSGAASELKAAQTEIIKEKAASMAIAMLLKKGFAGPGGNLESIISEDFFIMDGHHRWAATILCDPSAELQATQIMLPGGPLVTVLNIATKGLLGKAAGNSGTGAIAEFTAQNLTTVLDSFLQKGTGGSWTDFPLPAEDVKKALTDFGGGDLEAGKKKMAANADTLPKVILPGAPPRVEMPYIGPKEVAIVAKALANGEIDITPPYSKQTLKVAPYLAKTAAPATAPKKAAAPVAESVHKSITKMLNEAIKNKK